MPGSSETGENEELNHDVVSKVKKNLSISRQIYLKRVVRHDLRGRFNENSYPCAKKTRIPRYRSSLFSENTRNMFPDRSRKTASFLSCARSSIFSGMRIKKKNENE